MATKAEKLFKKGQAQEKKGNFKKAWKHYRSACDHDEYDPDLWLARANAARELDDPADAVEALFHVTDLYVRTGMHEQAIEVADRVLELDPKHSGARRFKDLLTRKSAEREAVAAPEEAEEVAEPEPEPEPEKEPEKEAEAEEIEADAIEVLEAEPESGPPRQDAVAGEIVSDERYEVVIDRARTDSGAVAKPVDKERSARSVAAEYKMGRTTGKLALEELSLGEVLPSRRPRNETGEIEIDLDDEPETDVVRAVAATLTTSPLLSELDSDLVRRLVDCGKLLHVSRDELVFEEGGAGTSLFLILKGKVAIERGENGLARQLAVLKPGAFFGEMALLTNAPRSASVRALEGVDLLEVSRVAVRELVDRDTRVLKLLMRFFRARLVGTLLATSPLFRGFDRERKRALVGKFRLRELKPGHLILKVGERAEGLYLVLVGQLQVFVGGAITDPKVLGTLGPGDVFGEMSLLDGTGAMANVRTQGRSWVLLLPRDDFTALISEHPLMLEALAEIAEQRRNENQDILAQGGAPTPAAQVKPV